MAASATSIEYVEKMFIAYFGRPAAPTGLEYYAGLVDAGNVAALMDDFWNSTESQNLFGGLTTEAKINAIFQQLFGRDAAVAGLTYWTTQINSGAVSLPDAALTILNSAGAADLAVFNAKLLVANAFTAELDLTAEVLAYQQNIPGGYSLLASIQSDADATAALAVIATTVATVVAGGSTLPGTTYSLTSAVDNIHITTLNTADTVSGAVDGDWDADTSGSTFSPGDTIQGNGNTTLKLALTEGGNAAFASVKDIATIDLLAGASVGVSFNAVDWSNIGKIQLNAGANGAWAYFSNLQAGVDLSVGSAISASLTVDYTDGHGAWMYSDKGASIDYIDGGDINATAAAGKDVSATLWANTGGVSLMVGDVNFVGAAADSAYFSAWAGYNTGADITIGNVSMTGFDEVDFEVWNTDHTAASPASNVTIGDIALSVGKSGSISATVYNSGDGVVGNTTIGNIALTAGDNVTSAYFYQYQWGGMGAGDVTVGDVSVVAGVSASDADVWIENYAGWQGGAATAAITQGAMTVGNISYDLAMNATGYFSASAEAYTSAAGIDLTVGAYTIGNLSANLAQDAWLSMWFNQEAYAWGGGAATVGDVSIGNGNFDLAVDASLSYSVNVEAYSNGGPAATVGNVAIGNVDLAMGINTYASVEYSVYAYGTDPAQVSVGDVAIGGLNAVIDDGAHLDYSISITSYGDLGNVDLGSLTVAAGVSADAHIYWSDAAWASNDIASFTVGDVSLTAGQNADIYMYVSATASHDMGNVSFGNLALAAGLSASITVSNEISASNDMGNVSIGNVDLTAAKNAYIWASHDFSAWNGAIGNVDVGDVSAAAATSAYAGYWFYMSGETAVGNVSIGDVSVSALGLNASASVGFDIENDSVGTIGDITVGNVDVVANGDSAWGYFYVSASSASSAGTVTVGDLDLTVGTIAQKTAEVRADIGNDLGDVVVGDITVNAASVRATGDITMLNTVDINVWSAGDITLGVVKVTGGDGLADALASLTGGWLATTNGGGTHTTTIGGVDYSDYGVAATIDVSGFLGAATIKGSAFGDLITDNAGANTITGGAGADTFTFLNTNTGKTETMMDVITDFNNVAGDKIDLSVGVNVGNYGEASYADFAAFVTGANAADKAVMVGLIGNDGFAAVDFNTDGTVDFMIKLTGLTDLSNIDVASFV